MSSNIPPYLPADSASDQEALEKPTDLSTHPGVNDRLAGAEGGSGANEVRERQTD